MRFVHSASITLLARGLALPIGIASSVIIARTLGPEGRGILALLAVYQGLAIQFGTVGFNASVTYFLSREPQLHRPIIGTTVSTAIVAGVISGVLIALAAGVFPTALLGSVSYGWLLISLAALPFMFLQQFLQNVLLARQRIVAYNGVDLSNRSLQLAALAVLLLWIGEGALAAVWAISVVGVLSGVIAMGTTFYREPVSLRPDGATFKRMTTYGLRLYAASVLMFLVFRVQVVLVNAVAGESAAGIYAVAFQLADLIYLLPVTLGTLLFPRISMNARDDGQTTARLFRVTMVAMLLLCGAMAMGAEWIITRLYGESFADATETIQWLLPGVFTLSLVTILNNDLTGRGIPWGMVVIPAIALLFVGSLSSVLIPGLGINGAAMSASAGNCLMLFLTLRLFSRRADLRISTIVLPRRDDFRIR
ncbi:MAG: oligosaccharide flippase family protein [Bacteroidetes bacterium]|jgi:O-antigen/teichoic acid export membrane protein|nr:oligosaccharide flippase family protein [Bacteroidota bacterium]